MTEDKPRVLHNGNEPAMPIWFEGSLGQMNSTGGLTIRQHFAAMAMQGLISSPEDNELSLATMLRITGFEATANHAVRYADALITELNKTNDHD